MKKTFMQWLDLLKFKNHQVVISATKKPDDKDNYYILKNKEHQQIQVNQDSMDFLKKLNKR